LAVRELKKEGVKFLSLGVGDEVPPDVDVIITSSSERQDIAFPKVVSAATAAEAVHQAISLKTGLKKSYGLILVGIDPGKSIGIVALGDRRVVFEDILSSPEEVLRALRKIEDRFQPREIVIKVGASGGSYRNRIIAGLQENFRYPIEVVDEGSTSQPKGESKKLGLHKDILAARKIVSKKGKTLNKIVEVTSTPGEIKNVQKESRKRSGHLTISKELAESVVKGELSLEEAIRIQKRRGDENLYPP
jgi:hypothetical protein